MTPLERAKEELAHADAADKMFTGISARDASIRAAKAYALVSIAESLENIVFVVEERIVKALERAARS